VSAGLQLWTVCLTANRASSKLSVPLPEIPFGNNELRLEHAPSQFVIRFDALDALRQVDGTGQEAGTVQVAYADDWQKSRQGLGMEKMEGKRWDWTYSTTYAGSQVTCASCVTSTLHLTMHSQAHQTTLCFSSHQTANQVSH
jgi:hypothetical protein